MSKQLSPAERAARVTRAELMFLRAHHGRMRSAAIRAVLLAGYSARAAIHAALGHKERSLIFRAMARTVAFRPDGAQSA